MPFYHSLPHQITPALHVDLVVWQQELTCVFCVIVRQEERAEKVEEGDDEEQPEEEGARAEGQEAVSTPEDQGGDCLGASVPVPRIHTIQ